MRRYLKQRTRLLVAAEDWKVQQQLIPILTGFEFYVDYVSNISDGIDKFKAYRHPVVLIDEALVTNTPSRVLGIFHLLQKDCMVVLLSKPENRPKIKEILLMGAFDVLELPINPDEIHIRIQRLIKHHKLIVTINYLKLLFIVGILLLPPILGLVWYLR